MAETNWFSQEELKSLSPLDIRFIEKQATINVGTVGHVAHGKSTVVKSLSGVHTVKFKNEKERNITIQLGYANTKIYKCPECLPPKAYQSFGSRERNPMCKLGCGNQLTLLRHFSFVDCPGHEILMATMLNGAAVMDAALLLIAANESCPMPQTSEHLAAIELMRLKHLIILQNKSELVTKEKGCQRKLEIDEFLKGTVAENAPIIPISAVTKYNLDVLCEYLCTQIPVPIRDFASDPYMIVLRSFDINRPGDDGTGLKGGVAGGSLLRGIIRVGDIVEIRPGVVQDSKTTPLLTKVVSLHAEENTLDYAVPGGLIGVGTKLDPAFTKGNFLVGQIIGLPGRLPDVLGYMQIKFNLLKKLLGVKSGAVAAKVVTLALGEWLLINIGSTTTVGEVKALPSSGHACVYLKKPVCAKLGEKLALSRKIEKNWRLIGWGVIEKGSQEAPKKGAFL